MTSSIPSGFSSDDLQKLLDNAKPEPEAHVCDENCDHDNKDMSDYEQNVRKVVAEALDSISEKIDGPTPHKCAMMMILQQMYEWHMRMAHMKLDEGERDAADCWTRDAGQLQVVNNILLNISVGPEDFMLSE